MEHVWFASYPDAMPRDIDPDQHRSLAEIIDSKLQAYADAPAYTNLDTTLSFADIDRLSGAFAAYLQQSLKLPVGSRVAIMMPNLLQYPVALFGALRAGYVVVNVNPLYTARELRHQLTDSGAVAIVILENFAHTLAEVMADCPLEHVIVSQIGDLIPWPRRSIANLYVKYVKHMVPSWRIERHITLRRALRIGQGLHREPVELSSGDLAFLQYTGGTTGVAKGAALTQRNLIANLLQVRAWMGAHLQPGSEVVITALPLYHIFSLTVNCLTFLYLGGHNILITNPRDMPQMIKSLQAHRFTIITAVNTLFNGLLNAPGFADLDFTRLKLSVGGGMAVQKSVADRWQEQTGSVIIEGYGLTETSPVACVNRLDIERYSGGIGYPVPSTEAKIIDEHGQAVGFDTPGELCIRGPQVMQSYWQRPEETANVLVDGWLRTGDVATMNERGFLRIVDRTKDMILVSGFNVYPNELEEVIASHPGVLEVAAIGLPDERTGEQVKVFVVKKDTALTREQILRHCKDNLTAYKVPKQVEFRDELPKTNVGKILRRALRDEALKGSSSTASTE